MTTLDIRVKQAKITKIKFADQGIDDLNTSTEVENCEGKHIHICETGGDTVRIRKLDIPDLILALKKATELGWHLP